jgi:hypothetical protein
VLKNIVIHCKLIMNPRGTNWGSFLEGLRVKLDRGPEMNMKDEAG